MLGVDVLSDDASTKIPRRQTLSAVEYVGRRSIRRLVGEGLCLYLGIVLAVTCLQRLLIQAGFQVVVYGSSPVRGWLHLIYFNLVTVLTIGYGDYAPVGAGRVMIAVEALFGVGLFGTLIGAVVVKAMLPRRDSVVFSRYCYFAKQEQRFVLQFVNTTTTRLVNVDMCSLLKLGRVNKIHQSAYRTPYVGKSGWTMTVNGLKEYLDASQVDAVRAERTSLLDAIDSFLSKVTLYEDDGLKFGLTGSHGFSVFSTSKKYGLDECLVVETRGEIPVDVLREPDFKSPEFVQALHYVPKNKQTFLEYAEQKGATIPAEED